MKKILFFIILAFCFESYSNSFYSYDCRTLKQHGLDFLGKDHKRILKFLGMDNFKLKVERKRQDIFESLKREMKNKKNYSPKSSHFIDLTIIKNNGNLEGMNCSWRYDIRVDEIQDRLFNCVDRKSSKNVFNLDFNGNFIYSSTFADFYYYDDKQKNQETLHSVFGKCIESKLNSTD